MQASLWVLFSIAAIVHTVAKEESLCKWLSQHREAKWKSVSRFTTTQHIFYIDNLVVCMEPAEESNVVDVNLTLSRECETNPLKLSQSIDYHFLYFFKFEFGTICFWRDWLSYFHWTLIHRKEQFEFSRGEALFPFSLVYDYYNQGYVFNKDSVHNTTNWLLYPLKVGLKLKRAGKKEYTEVEDNFHYNPREVNTSVLYFELTNTSGQFLVRHQMDMTRRVYSEPGYSERVIFKAKPLGFIFQSRMFLIDTVRACVYHFPLAAFHTATSFILHYQSMPLDQLFGCQPGLLRLDESQCRPRLPYDLEWQSPVGNLPDQQKISSQIFKEIPFLIVLVGIFVIVLICGSLLVCYYKHCHYQYFYRPPLPPLPPPAKIFRIYSSEVSEEAQSTPRSKKRKTVNKTMKKPTTSRKPQPKSIPLANSSSSDSVERLVSLFPAATGASSTSTVTDSSSAESCFSNSTSLQ